MLAVSVGAARVPKDLATLNYVRFDPFEDGRQRSFMAGLGALVKALNTDVDWLREHTRYLSLARSWDEVGRPQNRLLSGSDVAAAKDWLLRRRIESPEPTVLHLDFIRESESAETSRQNDERKRLDEIEAAQKAREKALALAEDAVAREKQATAEKSQLNNRLVQRTRVGIVAALILAGTAVSFAVYGWKQKQNAEAAAGAARRTSELLATLSPEANRVYRLIELDPAGQRVMKKICQEAIGVTLKLATTEDKAVHDETMDRFLELYYGPMYLVELHQRTKTGEPSTIEAMMVNFKNMFDDIKGESLPHRSLCPASKAVRDACNEYLNLDVSEACK